MVRRAVTLSALDVTSTDGAPEGKKSGGAQRSNPRRSARRLSPYGAPSPTFPIPPPTTGLSSAIQSMAMASAPRSGKRKAVVKADELVGLMATKGPIGRQIDKEDKWKSKTSWWDVARDETRDPTHDKLHETGRFLQDGGSVASGGCLPLPSAMRARNLLRGRTRSQAHQKDIDKWRGEEIDTFLAREEATGHKAQGKRRSTRQWARHPMLEGLQTLEQTSQGHRSMYEQTPSSLVTSLALSKSAPELRGTLRSRSTLPPIEKQQLSSGSSKLLDTCAVRQAACDDAIRAMDRVLH